MLWNDVLQLRNTERNPAAAVEELLQVFRSKNRPEFNFKVDALTQARQGPELISDAESLPHLQVYPYAQVQQLAKHANDCEKRFQANVSGDLKKTLLWERFNCGHASSLPKDFFKTPPLVHPSGASFVQLAVRSDHAEYHDDAWKKNYVRYSHILEDICDKDSNCQTELPL